MCISPLRHSCGFARQQYVSINRYFLKHDASSSAALLKGLVARFDQRTINFGVCAMQQRAGLDLVLEIARALRITPGLKSACSLVRVLGRVTTTLAGLLQGAAPPSLSSNLVASTAPYK